MVLVSCGHIAWNFIYMGLLLQQFLWDFLRLLGRLLSRNSFGGYYLCHKTCKEECLPYYLLTCKNAVHNINFVDILQGAYNNANLCFFFGKYENLRTESY